MDKKDKYSQFGPAVQCSNSIGSQQQWEFDEDFSCFSRNKFALSVMNFLGCIKETMDNSFFYGMMEENTSKKGVYCWFPACRPIPAFHPIRSADRKDVEAGSPFG